jgi:hypothetical protein
MQTDSAKVKQSLKISVSMQLSRNSRVYSYKKPTPRADAVKIAPDLAQLAEERRMLRRIARG